MNFIPAAPGWLAVHLDKNGVERVRPLAAWLFDDKGCSDSFYCDYLGSLASVSKLPYFVGVVGPGQDYRSVLLEIANGVRSRLPKAKEPARDEPISFDDRGRFRHG